MEVLMELASVCRAAETDKVTERKRQMEKMTKLLNDVVVVKALDKCSDVKDSEQKKRSFTWDKLFKATKRILWAEGESLKKAKSVDTATSVKKKQEAAQLYKLVVKMADKRGPRLKSGDLVQDVIDVLSDPFMCSLFGMSHTSLLQKHILCMRKYWVQMSSKSWHELLGWYCKMLSDPPPHFDRTLLAQVVHTVVHGATQQCDIRGKKLLPLLQNYFTNVKQEKAKMICDYMVSSLNILCRALAPDGRTQLCRIGENTATHMLYLWNHRPSDKLKDELIDFFHLQMCAHHPQGVRTEEEGAFALDWDIWKGHMKRLYEVIYSDLLEHGGRNKFAASERSMFFSGRDMCGKPAYVTLMADLCHQLYSDTSACVLEVTQLSFLQSQPGGATKKRRLESGWSVLREAITAHGHTTQSVPWLQLVTVILDKYPLSLPEDELEPLLSVLQLLQGECRRVDVLSWMLRCLRSVAFSQQKSKNKLLDMTSDACAALWEKVWAATLRSLSLHHAEQEGFQLLTTLLQCHLVSADNNVWTLYLPGVCPPSAPAVDFLAAFLSWHDLPEKHRPGLLSVGTENGQESHPLRLQLLDWLIPNKEDTLVTAGGSTGCIQDANLLGELLVVLTLRDTRHIKLSSSHLKEEPDRYSQIEDIYLKTTFDRSLGKAEVDASDNGKENGVKCSVLGKVQTQLLDLLQRDGRQLLDITTDPEVAQVERLVWQCQVIMKVIHAMLHHNVISGHQVAQLPLCDMMKLLMKRLGSWLGVVVRRESVPSLAGILSGMCDLLTVSDQHISSQRHQMALIIRAVTSPKILDQLFEIAYNKVLPPGGDDATPSTSSGVTRRPSRPAVDEFDDFDLDVNASMDIEEDNDALGESQGSDGLTPGSGSVCESLLSRSHLSDAQSIQLQAIKALCAWCDHSVEAASTVTSSRHPEFTPTDCKKKLLDLLSDDRWDCMKPFDLQLMQCIFEGLCGSDQNLSGEEVEEIVDVLREACKAHRRDQETCAVLLNLMSRLVPHLQDTHDMVSPAMQRARELCAYLHGIFWKLSQSLEYIVSTRVVIAQSMQAFLQVDPDASWAIYKRRDEEDVAMVDEYCKLLSDKNVTLRLHAASRLAILFERAHGGASVAQERWKQNDMFDSVYNTQIEIMDIEGRLSEDEIKDESVCRASSLLHTLSSVARISPVCERKALFAVCQMYKEHNLNKLLVKKVLCQVARDLHYSSLQSYMSTHLPYIIQQWFIQKYTLDNFPYPLMGYATRKDFYEAQCNVLVPFVVMNKDLDSVSQMGEVMQCAWKDLLLDGVPHILIHILPLFAASKSAHLADDRALRKRIPHATACYDLLTKVISKESVQKAMGSHLEDIVVNTLMTLQTSSPEGAAGSSDAHSNDPIPNPPHFKRETVIATLEYLTQSYGGNVNSVVALLAKSQDGIQRVLLSLRTHMAQSHRPHETRRILHMYSLFVKLLLEEFQGGLGGSWAYVLRDVTFTLIHTLHSYSKGECSSMEGDVACMCVDLLHSVCQTAAVSCPEELCHFMPTIISAVLPSVGKERKLSKLCVGLIELLLVEHGGCLQVALAVLDPLPDIRVLAAARKRLDHYRDPTRTDLAQEIRRFLELTELCAVPSSDSRLSGLIFLKEQLAGNKPQLSQLVSECENDQGNSLLVRLVYELIQLTKSTNQDVAQEAGRCLGEIGPVDLSVVAIETRPLSQSLASAVKSFEDNSSMKQYCHIFHLLDKYLMEASVPVVTAASQVLKQILSTKTGLAFYSSYKDNVKDTFFQYLRPFKTKSKVAAVSDSVISEEVFLERVDEVLLWLPNHADHGRWVCDLACRLADCSAIYDEVLRLLTPVCKVKEEFSEKVIPYLIHNILLHGSQVHKDVLSRHIKDFFASHCGVYEQAGSRPTTPSTPEPSGECTVTTNKDSVGVMLNVIQYLRLQDRPAQGRQKFTSWDNNMWLDVDFLHIAKAAQNCRAYFTTLLYSEIWCDIHRASADTEEFSEGSTWDVISQVAAPTNIDIQSLMLEAYQSIGDPDGMYGCGAGRLAQMSSRMRMYEHEGRWNEALGAYDLHMLQSTASKTQLGLLKAMQNFGLGHVLDLYLRGLTSQHSTHLADIQDVQYEAAWRNTTWDLATPTRFDGSCGYHQCVYSSLWAVKEGDEAMLTSAVRFARRGVLECVASCSLESVRSLYPSLAQLQCLSHIEDAATLPQSLTQLNLRAITNKWLHREAGLDNDYEFMEPVLSLRCSLLHTLHTRGQCAATLQALTAQLECATSMARQASRHQLAERALQQLRHLVTVESSAESWSWQIEEAKLCWARGEQETAKHLLKVLTGKLEKAQDESMEAARIYPQCLGVFGDWLAHTHSENATVIMDNYLKKAVDLLEVMGCEDDAALDSFLALGRFADGQYQNRDNYMKSSTFEAKQALARQAKEDALQLQRMGDTKTRYYRTLARQSDIDEKEVASLISDKDKFLLCAVHNYLKCLQGGHKHDLRVFRLTSLWFDNATNNSVNSEVKKCISKIQSYKFLPLMYQLAARMSQAQQHDKDLFQPTLDKVIERTVLDHPHHTMFIILALAHANKDNAAFQNTGRKSTGRLSKSTSQDQEKEEDRVLAAKAMVGRVKQSHRAEIITDMERLCLAYIQLANWNVEKYKTETKAIKLPEMIKIKQMKHLTNVAIPTVETKVDPSCKYDNIVYIEEFESTFKLAGGINLPKIISCVGSDGVARRQLVKGKDDLRQDAVMQQVFSLVNNMLHKVPNSRKRKLQVRTYKVIPLSQRSGLLEWCEGTIPIGAYLTGHPNGAHQRYRPGDLKASECRSKLADAHNGKSRLSRYDAFREVCRKFQPVFRHFFMEKFPDPAQWYERQLAYTRSVATNSIVGYILGLGDRHVQNILIDCQTAELIHIDLGVAFEQGKILPTPETVPFRLTRDIVDGMGVAGVEGAFRRCCEATMEVMHQSHEALLTILQVLLYDPLSAWTISPLKAYALQQRRESKAAAEHDTDINTTGDILDITDAANNNSNSGDTQDNVNKMAERVLLRLRQKLQGLEEGVQLSVSGQVNMLIQEARDQNNLCRLFPGWQPYI